METLLIVFQVILAILIVLIVLVNVTKGSEYGAVFRGAEAIFGGAGPTSFLNKVTMALVVLFFLNSLILTKYVSLKHRPALPEGKVQQNVPSSSQVPIPPSQPFIPQQPQAPEKR
jgi:preprotein translocase subunit SecG